MRGGKSARVLVALAAAGLAAAAAWGCSRDTSREGGGGTTRSTRQALGALLVSAEVTFGGKKPPQQRGPKVAFNGSWWLAAWEETDAAGTWWITTARVAVDGSVLDATPRHVTSFALRHWFSLASDGDGFLLAWDEQLSDANWYILGVRLDAGGVPLDAQPQTLVSYVWGAPHVAGRAGGYLLAWAEPWGGEDCFSYEIGAARVASDGTALDPTGFTIAVTTPFCLTGYALADVAADSQGFLVGWGEMSNTYPSVLRTARVAPDGSMGAIQNLAPAPNAWGLARPALATGTSGFLAAWDLYFSDNGISALALWPDGTARSSQQALVPLPAAWPVVAYVGGEYMVFGAGARSGRTTLSGQRVGEGGAVLDATPFPIAATISDGSETAASGDSCGHALVAYTRPLTASPNATDRVGLRLVTDPQIVSAGCPYPAPDAGTEDAAAPGDAATSDADSNDGSGGGAGNADSAAAGSGGTPADAAVTDSAKGGSVDADASDGANANAVDATDDGSTASASQSEAHAGCACRTGQRKSASSPWALVLSLLVMGFWRRRRDGRAR